MAAVFTNDLLAFAVPFLFGVILSVSGWLAYQERNDSTEVYRRAGMTGMIALIGVIVGIGLRAAFDAPAWIEYLGVLLGMAIVFALLVLSSGSLTSVLPCEDE